MKGTALQTNEYGLLVPGSGAADAGETSIVCIAPAVGSAILDTTQIRLRSMPMTPDGLKV